MKRTLSLLLFLSAALALALMVSAPEALAATMQVSVSEDTPPPLIHKLKDGTTLHSVGKPGELELSISRPGMRPVTISLPYDFVQIDRVVPAQGNEVLLIGMNGDTFEVVIVDIVNYRVIDHFWCYYPDVSPNGQLIAFIKWYPPHFDPNVTEIVMIYDLTQSPASNRSSGQRREANELGYAIDVGMRVYPPGTNAFGNNEKRLPDTMLDQVSSAGFFWTPDSSKFVFANEHVIEAHPVTVQDRNARSRIRLSKKVELSLVLVNPAVSHAAPIVTVFPVRECQQSCNQELFSVEFTEDGVKAQFQGPDTKLKKQSLEVKYAEFRAP